MFYHLTTVWPWNRVHKGHQSFFVESWKYPVSSFSNNCQRQHYIPKLNVHIKSLVIVFNKHMVTVSKQDWLRAYQELQLWTILMPL